MIDKKKSLILIVLLSLFNLTIWAGDFVFVENSVKIPDYLIGFSNQYLYGYNTDVVTYTGETKKVTFIKYDIKTLKKTLEREVAVLIDKEKTEFVKAFLTNHGIFVVSKMSKKKVKQDVFYITKLDSDFNLSESYKFGILRRKSSARIGVDISSTNVLSFVSEKLKYINSLSYIYDSDNKENKKQTSTLIKVNETNRTTSEIELPVANKDANIIKEAVSDNGLTYILGTKGIIVGGLIKNDLFFSYIDNETKEHSNINIRINHIIKEVDFSIADNEDIYLTAFTCSEKKVINGLLTIVYDKELNEKNRKFAPLTEGFINSKATKESGKLYKYNFEHKYLFFNNNKTISILAEQRAEGQFNDTPINYYLDVVVFNINLDGSLNWKMKIPKFQEIKGYKWYDQSSYFAFPSGEDITLLYSIRNVQSQVYNCKIR